MLQTFKAYQIAKNFYWECKRLRLPSGIKDQLVRASQSVALNLAEGSAKRTFADQRRFYSMAYGSIRECQAVLDLEKIEDPKLIELSNQLGAILFKLSIRSSDPNHRT